MKFTDLDTSTTRDKPIRIDLDAHSLKIGDKIISLEGQWIDVYPTDSDKFIKAKLELQRKASAGLDFEPDMLVASLIAAWSFEEECDIVNTLAALKIWPKKLIDQIDSVASKEINFTVSKRKSL
jgi:hypothetical protein